LQEADALIAADAASNPAPPAHASVALTVDGLLVNHDTMNLIAMLRREPVQYLGWQAAQPGNPDYVLHAKGFGSLYPGRQFVEYAPHLDAEVSAGKHAYEEVSRLGGPSGAELIIYRTARRTLRGAPGQR
jgi:hypothetical protein